MTRFLIYWLPVLIWASLIFYASSQPYEEQNVKPVLSQYLDADWIGERFSGVVFHYAGAEVSVEALGAAGFIEFFIRKGAHLTVYVVLAFLLYRALWRSIHGRRKAFWLAWGLAVLYAASDEWHQGFTADRTPLVHDVALDAFGALLGSVVGFCLYRKGRNCRNW